MLVYKYRGGAFKRDLNSLKNDEFWASSTSQLNDPCEGVISIDDLEQQLNYLKNIFYQHSDNLAIIEQRFHNTINMKDTKLGIFSLSKTYSDELLWAHYANSHKGFCIEYDLDLLLSKQDLKHRFFDIQYSDKMPNLGFSQFSDPNNPDILIKKMLGYKSKRWEYEQELRIITENKGINTYDYGAVKAIYFGLKTPKSTISKIIKTLQGRKIKYFQMYLKPNSFKFEAKPIEDKFPTNERYKYSIAPIAEHLPTIKISEQEYEKYSPYLQKLAEIARREPNCNEVLELYLSPSKSTPHNPIFYVQYINSDTGFYQTDYYNLKEVDGKFELIDDL